MRKEVSFAAFANGLDSLGGGVNFQPLAKIVRLQLVADAKGNFLGEHDPDGTPWAPLKRPRPSKGRAKKKKYNGQPQRDRILQDTGRLRASVASAFGGETVNREGDDGFEWGTNVPYGVIHQEGTKKKDGTPLIPARPFIGVGQRLEASIAALTEEWVAEKVLEIVGSAHA